MLRGLPTESSLLDVVLVSPQSDAPWRFIPEAKHGEIILSLDTVGVDDLKMNERLRE